MARSLFWLSDEAWKTLEPHLPHGKPGKPRVDLWGACPLGRGRTCRGAAASLDR
jgi:transposase